MKIENSILKTIGYFDMFRYPVTSVEIWRFLCYAATPLETGIALKQLVNQKKIFQLDEFYSLQNDHALVDRRRRGNAFAAELLKTAYRVGKRLYKFPFVKGVGISGSLSKNYADADADIDLFIITQTGYLWIARSLLHILKKFSFLTGKQDWYCMNYFIDEAALVIAEKNIFTATEVVTLKPVCGSAMPVFYKANQWAFDLFPNDTHNMTIDMDEANTPRYKKWIEKIFTNRLGNRLDDYLMRLTAKRWQKKEMNHKINSKGDPMGLLAGKHFARPNPEYFQKKLLGIFNDRLQDMEEKWGIRFDSQGHFLRKEII